MGVSKVAVCCRSCIVAICSVLVLIYIFVSITDTFLGPIDHYQETMTPRKQDPKAESRDRKLKKDLAAADPSELRSGTKRFKLYEKKPLTHDKAKEYCRKERGKLAQSQNLHEMTRLQTLLMRAKMIGQDIWIGVEKKEWKKYANKIVTDPRFGEHNLGSMSVKMMGGGGPKVMCPALSTATRSLTPADCRKKLPYICEYEIKKEPKTTTTPKPKKRSQPTTRKPTQRQVRKSEPKTTKKPIKKQQLYERPDKAKKKKLKENIIKDKYDKNAERNRFIRQREARTRIRDEMK